MFQDPPYPGRACSSKRSVRLRGRQRRPRQAHYQPHLEALEERNLLSTVAYQVPAGTVGQQAFNGPLGMDFNVNSDIVVTQLGVFHDSTFLSSDLQAPLQARLYQRDDTNAGVFALLATIDFPVDDEGTPIDSSFFTTGRQVANFRPSTAVPTLGAAWPAASESGRDA